MLRIFKGNGYGNGTKIDLSINQNLNRFESTVFQSVVEKMTIVGGWPKSYVQLLWSKKSMIQTKF